MVQKMFSDTRPSRGIVLELRPEVKEKKAFVLFSTATSPSPAILRLMVYSGHINALYLESARLVRRLIVRNRDPLH